RHGRAVPGRQRRAPAPDGAQTVTRTRSPGKRSAPGASIVWSRVRFACPVYHVPHSATDSARPMPADHRSRFLQLALDADALRFGEFTLKSGRVSPYFFNAGHFDSGAALATLAGCYADAIDAAGLEFDLLFGPAYKGIPLATALACEYARRGRDLPVAFNRKEAKDHGEGGSLIGAPLAGRRVLVVDDVITAGTAVREALATITAAGGSVAALAIALDRQEAVAE